MSWQLETSMDDLTDWNAGVEQLESGEVIATCAVCGTLDSPSGWYFRDGINFDPAYGFVCHEHRYVEGHIYRHFHAIAPTRDGRKVFRVKARNVHEAVAFINMFGGVTDGDIEFVAEGDLSEQEVADLTDLDQVVGSSLRAAYQEESTMAQMSKVKTDSVRFKAQPVEIEHVPHPKPVITTIETFELSDGRSIKLDSYVNGDYTEWRLIILGGDRPWVRRILDKDKAVAWLESYKKLHFNRLVGGLYRSRAAEGFYNIELKSKEFTGEDGEIVDVVSKYVVTLELDDASGVDELGEFDTLFAARQAAQAEHTARLSSQPSTVEKISKPKSKRDRVRKAS